MTTPITFEKIATELADLPEGERAAFAAFLMDTRAETARDFMRELGFADMDRVYRTRVPGREDQSLYD